MISYSRLCRLVPAALLLGPSLAWTAQANTFYRCVDASGSTLYTNQKGNRSNCTVLSVAVPPSATPGKAGANAASRTPSPTDFPKVAQNEQQARDTDRRRILETELANERNQLDAARKQLGDAQKTSAVPAQSLKDSVALHERNVEALTKEMAKLR